MGMFNSAKEYNVVNEKSIAKCQEYSENADQLASLINQLVFKVVSTGIRKYFPDDVEERECLNITVGRNDKSINFDFGLSIVDTFFLNAIANMLKLVTVSIRTKEGKYLRTEDRLYYGDTELECIPFSFPSNAIKELKRDSFSKPALTSYLRTKKEETINGILYSVLCSIRSDFYIPECFEYFCAEFGYDTNSRQAEKTFQGCQVQAKKLRSIFNESDIDCMPS